MHEFHLVRIELDIVLYLSLLVFLLPVSIFCKYVYSKLTNSNFIITVSNYMDVTIVLLNSWMWIMVFKYNSDIKRELFNPEEDKGSEVRFIGNMVYDIVDDDFHFDYLMAGITAVLWLRCIMILRLTQLFGPTVVMIFRMTSIILQFFVIYVIGLITFASIGTMTLSEADEFHELFDALRIYLMASLGNFDLYQYEDLQGWKKYYGILLHVLVLFFYMILMINLLIAIMSDEYNVLSSVKTGLYWRNVILDMPKFTYNKYYGSLTMLPFALSWISLLVLPFLYVIKNRTTLFMINKVVFVANYFPIFLVTLIIFMAMNLVLLPFAYLKTIFHKITLLRRYRGAV